MHAARGYLNLTLLGKNLSDATIRPTTASEFTDECPVRLQAGARRFVGQAVEDFLEFGVHGQGTSLTLLYLKSHEQSLDVHLIST